MKIGQCLSGAIAGSAFLAAAYALPAAAADRQLTPDTGLPLDYVRYVEAIRKGLGSENDSDTARSVHNAAQVWGPNYKILRVCFFDGTQDARAVVAKAASAWMAPDNSLKFDFGKPGDYHTCDPDGKTEMQIRITFEEGGYNSALGTDSVLASLPWNHSMRLGGMGKHNFETPYIGYYMGVIRHEFGHALALNHEHQSPGAPCKDEYVWDKVYEYLGGPPDNWPKEVIDFNMRPLNKSEVEYSEFDVRSIMIYRFDAKLYKAGTKAKCYLERPNSEISEGDRQIIAKLYPADPSASMKRFEKAKADFVALWNQYGAKEERSASFDPVKGYFERAGNRDEPDEIPE